MYAPKRLVPVVSIVAFIFLITLLYSSRSSWHELPKHIGLGEWAGDRGYTIDNPSDVDAIRTKPQFRAGVTKPPGYNYTKMLIVPRTMSEDVSWMDDALPSDIHKSIYIADDPSAPLHVPKNKGHEVMIYLTYIIDHYDNLPDVMLFMHAHEYTWHNNDLLGGNAGEMIRRLSPERVTREGYMNLRCQWYPGCPDWMHPGETSEDQYKSEQHLIAKAWAEIFPLDQVPDVLAQPCCAQFALSRERVRAIPHSLFVYYRNWLLKTPLKDFVSGRVWEYMWQFVFTGQSVFCPLEHACYCDGYGVCFGGKQQYDAWFELRDKRGEYNAQLLEWEQKVRDLEDATNEGRDDDAANMEKPEPGKDVELRSQIEALDQDMNQRLALALERGLNPRNRAEEAGRPWTEGDGF